MSSLRRSAAISLAGLLINATHALAAEKVGEAVLIKTAVLGGNRPLVVKAPVHQDERIRTSNTGLGQFVFRDGTKLAVGWGSSVVIDKYVFDDSTRSRSFRSVPRKAPSAGSAESQSPPHMKS